MGRTYRRRALDRKKTLRKQRGGLVEAKNSACTDDHRPLLAYHLYEDMKHDFGATAVNGDPVNRVYGSPKYDGEAGEDKVVKFFIAECEGKPTTDLIPDCNLRYKNKLIFSVQEETAVFGNDNVPVVLPRGTTREKEVQRNTDVAIVQDAGKQLFKELGATNLITFGSILDPALKPISPETNPFCFITPDKTTDIPACEYGFNPAVLQTIHIEGFTGDFVKCSFQDGEGWTDAIEMNLWNVGKPKPKPINNVKIEDAGYFTSIANVNDIERDVTAQRLFQGKPDAEKARQTRFFYIGKALGDTLLVASIQRFIDLRNMTSNPFLLTGAMDGKLKRLAPGNYALPAELNYFVLNTGDRLNHTRAFIKGVPSIYQQQRKADEKSANAVKKFEYIPGALLAGENFPGETKYYKDLIGNLSETARVRYDQLIANLQQESGVGGAGAAAGASVFNQAFAKFRVTDVEFPNTPAKIETARQLIEDVVTKLRILREVIPTFFTRIVAGLNDNIDNAKTTYRRACEYFKLLTPQKTTFQFQTGDVTLTTPALVVIRLPSNVNFSDLIPGGLSDPRIPGGLKGTFTIKLLRAFDNIRRGDLLPDILGRGTEYYKFFANKFAGPAGGGYTTGGANASTATEYDHLRTGFFVQNRMFPIPEVEKVRAFYMSSYSQDPQREELYANLPLLDLFNHRRAGDSMDEPLQMALHLQAYKDNGSVLDPQLATRFIEEAKRLHQASGGSTYIVDGRTDSILVQHIRPAASGTQTEWTLAFNSFAECLNADISERFGFIDAEEKEVAESDDNLLREMFRETCAKFVGMTQTATQIQDGYTLAGSPPQTPVRAATGSEPSLVADTLSFITGYLSQPGSQGRGGISEGRAEASPARGQALQFPASPGRNIANSVLPQLTRLSDKQEDPDPPATIVTLGNEVADAFRILVGEERRPRQDVESVLAGLYAPTGNVGQMTAAPGVQGQGLGGLSPGTASSGTETPTEEQQAEMQARLLADEATRLRGIAQRTGTFSDIAATEVAERAAQEAEKRLRKIREAQSDEEMRGIQGASESKVVDGVEMTADQLQAHRLATAEARAAAAMDVVSDEEEAAERATGRKRGLSSGRYSRDEIEKGVDNLRIRIQELRETLETLNLDEGTKDTKLKQINEIEDGLRFVESLLNTSVSEAGNFLEELSGKVDIYEEEVVEEEAEQAINAALEFINRNQGDPRLAERQEMLNDAIELRDQGNFQEAINTANNSRGPMGGGARRVLPDLNLPPPMAGRRRRSHRKRL